MPLDPVTQLILGFPIGVAANITTHLFNNLLRRLNQRSMEKIFFDTFIKTLEAENKALKGFLKKIVMQAKTNRENIPGIFAAGIKIKDMSNVSEVFKRMETEDYRKQVAREMVKIFSIEPKFQETIEVIIKQCLDNYKQVFLNSITTEEGVRLLVAQQFQNDENLFEILKGIVELNKKIEKTATKQDVISAIEDLKQFIMQIFPLLLKPLKDQIQKPPVLEEKKPIQIKILSMMASPEAEKGDYYIQYEKEQDTMLEVFKDFNREKVFPDMPDPVKSTLVEIKEHLQDGYHDILHITAHGGIDEKGQGFLCLEDTRGKLQKVTGPQLAKTLKQCPTPKIVILSACHSAGEKRNPDFIPVARALFKARIGLHTVIGMKKSISHDAAINFNKDFFKALCEGNIVKEAFKKGKAAILKGELRRRENNPEWHFLDESEIPALLTRKEGLSAEEFSQYRIKAPGRPQSHQFMGAKYLERGFIGRREILRKIYRAVEKNQGAVVLKGPGGIGKSTITTRAAANLHRKGYDFIVVQGETSIEKILEAISLKAAEKGVEKAREIYEKKDVNLMTKLKKYLDCFLLKQNIVVIFDNFEENQDEEKSGEFLKDRLKKFLWYFRDALRNKGSVLFFSTRYKLPDFETIEIGEFSTIEFRKMLLNTRALKKLDDGSIKTLLHEIGGNPRALELLDRVAWQEFGQRGFNWEELKELIPELQERLIHKKTGEDNFTPLFLGKLLGYLDQSQRRLLDVLSIYRVSVLKEAVMAHDTAIVRKDRKKLEDLSLLEYMKDKGLFYVHRLTAQYVLGLMEEEVRKQYHCRAGEYFGAIRNKRGKKYLNNDIESRWHFLQAMEWDRSAEITFSLEAYLTLHGYPQMSFELLKEVEDKALNDKNRSIVLNQMGLLYEGFGDYEEALEKYQQSMEIKEKIGDIKGVSSSLGQIGKIYLDRGDYDNSIKNFQKSMEISEKIGDIKTISTTLHYIGMIYQDKGDYEAALEKYQQSMEISEKTGDIKGVSSSLGQIGSIYQDKGDYDNAIKNFQKSMEISEKIGDIKQISKGLGNIGNIYQDKGDYEAALEKYQQSLEISEKIEDIKGVSDSLHNIGINYQEQGEYEVSLEKYQKSMEIKGKIGDIKGVSYNLHHIGMIYQDKGDYEAALEKYQQSLEIREKIGDIAGAASSMNMIGNIYFKKNGYATALKLYLQSFLIFSKIGSPNAEVVKGNIARVREKMPGEEFEAIANEFEGPGEEE